jgi:hypothetical protein
MRGSINPYRISMIKVALRTITVMIKVIAEISG